MSCGLCDCEFTLGNGLSTRITESLIDSEMSAAIDTCPLAAIEDSAEDAGFARSVTRRRSAGVPLKDRCCFRSG